MKNILVIDDDELVGKSVRSLLSKQKYNVSLVNNGIAALDLVSKDDFDLIISDIRMPGMDGIETIKKIKELQNKKDRKESSFLTITGYADDDAPQKGAELGIVDFVLKPFETEKFLSTVEKCLDNKVIDISTAEQKTRKLTPIVFPNTYFSTEKIVFLKQTNLMGNTYFANYIVWQGETREALLMTHPNFATEMQANQHVRMITHSVYHRFIEETTFGDVVEIRITIREQKKCSFFLVFRYYNKRTQSFIGEGWQRITFIDGRTGNFCRIPIFIQEIAMSIQEDTTAGRK